MTLTEKVIELANASIGFKEIPAGSNRGPEVDEYVRSVGLDPAGQYPWCAAYIYWLFQKASAELGVPNLCPRTGSAQGLWSLSRPEWRGHEPQEGSVFVMAFPNGTGHVGLVTSVPPGARVLITVEGNTNASGGSVSEVGVFERKRYRSTVSVGFLNFGGKK